MAAVVFIEDNEPLGANERFDPTRGLQTFECPISLADTGRSDNQIGFSPESVSIHSVRLPFSWNSCLTDQFWEKSRSAT